MKTVTKLYEATIGELERMKYSLSGFSSYELAKGWL